MVFSFDLIILDKPSAFKSFLSIDISMYGLYMILMIFQLTISIKQMTFAYQNQQRKPLTTLSGQISVSNCGSCCISVTCNLISTGHPTDPSSQRFLPLSVTVNTKRIVLTCTKFSCLTWMQLLQMRKNSTESMKENALQLLLQEPKYMNS